MLASYLIGNVYVTGFSICCNVKVKPENGEEPILSEWPDHIQSERENVNEYLAIWTNLIN